MIEKQRSKKLSYNYKYFSMPKYCDTKRKYYVSTKNGVIRKQILCYYKYCDTKNIIMLLLLIPNLITKRKKKRLQSNYGKTSDDNIMNIPATKFEFYYWLEKTKDCDGASVSRENMFERRKGNFLR